MKTFAACFLIGFALILGINCAMDYKSLKKGYFHE